jgi:hypothetical protein
MFFTSPRAVCRSSLFGIALWLLCAPLAHAAPLDTEELMSMAWEGMWYQGGAPVPLRKWTEPLRVRVQGDQAAGNSDVIRSSLDKISAATHLSYIMLSAESKDENLLIDVVTDSPLLNDSTRCITHLKFKEAGIAHATVTARNGKVWQCMLHELAHAVGVRGHPSQNSVLTYFGRRNDELSKFDEFVLSVRYSDALPDGTLPLAALNILARQHIQSLEGMPQKRQAQEVVNKFVAQTLAEAEEYARGGEPPRILYRSGRMTTQSLERGRVDMQYMLGMNYLHGHLGNTDPSLAKQWLTLAAQAGDARAQNAIDPGDARERGHKAMGALP